MILLEFDNNKGYQVTDEDGYIYYSTFDYPEAVAEFIRRALEQGILKPDLPGLDNNIQLGRKKDD